MRKDEQSESSPPFPGSQSFLVAVRCEGREGEEVVTGYVSRGKNRKRVWRFPIAGMTREEIREKVKEEETKRLNAKLA